MIENKTKEDSKKRLGIYQNLFFKIMSSVCWLVSCAITALSMAYVLPIKKIVLYSNTVGFSVSLLKSVNNWYFDLSI